MNTQTRKIKDIKIADYIRFCKVNNLKSHTFQALKEFMDWNFLLKENGILFV